jgi:hypothetical protein
MTMQISDWKSVNKNTVRAFFTVTLESGMIIHQCSLHEKDGQRWIGLPTEKFTKRDGSVVYSALIAFTSRQIADNFRRQVMIALEAEGRA